MKLYEVLVQYVDGGENRQKTDYIRSQEGDPRPGERAWIIDDNGNHFFATILTVKEVRKTVVENTVFMFSTLLGKLLKCNWCKEVFTFGGNTKTEYPYFCPMCSRRFANIRRKE